MSDNKEEKKFDIDIEYDFKRINESISSALSGLFEELKKINDQTINSLKQLEPILKEIDERVSYKGIEVKKYCKLRGMSIERLCSEVGVKRSTMYKYISGEIDIPASTLILISYTLNVSIDLLLKKKERKANTSYIGSELPYYVYDYDKNKYVKDKTKYVLDGNLKEYINSLIIVKYDRPIPELGLPHGSLLFITSGNDAIQNGINKRIAVCMREERKDGDYDEFYSYVSKLEGKDKDFSSSVNYQYGKYGRTYTTTLSTLKNMVQFVIHKAIIDF